MGGSKKKKGKKKNNTSPKTKGENSKQEAKLSSEEESEESCTNSETHSVIDELEVGVLSPQCTSLAIKKVITDETNKNFEASSQKLITLTNRFSLSNTLPSDGDLHLLLPSTEDIQMLIKEGKSDTGISKKRSINDVTSEPDLNNSERQHGQKILRPSVACPWQNSRDEIHIENSLPSQTAQTGSTWSSESETVLPSHQVPIEQLMRGNRTLYITPSNEPSNDINNNNENTITIEHEQHMWL